MITGLKEFYKGYYRVSKSNKKTKQLYKISNHHKESLNERTTKKTAPTTMSVEERHSNAAPPSAWLWHYLTQ